MKKQDIEYIEVHWWIKDSVDRRKVIGVDLITSEHINYELKHIASADCLEEFDEEDANFCLSEIADVGYNARSDGENNNGAFIGFYGAINVTVIEPIDFGVSKIKKIFKKDSSNAGMV